MRKTLIEVFCKEPYAGCLLVLLLEYFEELHSIKRKIRVDKSPIVALG
jgi:hypothetical protein